MWILSSTPRMALTWPNCLMSHITIFSKDCRLKAAQVKRVVCTITVEGVCMYCSYSKLQNKGQISVQFVLVPVAITEFQGSVWSIQGSVNAQTVSGQDVLEMHLEICSDELERLKNRVTF